MNEILQSPITFLVILYFAVPKKYHRFFCMSSFDAMAMRRAHYNCQTETLRVEEFLIQAESLRSNDRFAAYLVAEEVKQRFGTTDSFLEGLETSYHFVRPTLFSRKGNCPELLHVKLYGKIKTSVTTAERSM